MLEQRIIDTKTTLMINWKHHDLLLSKELKLKFEPNCDGPAQTRVFLLLQWLVHSLELFTDNGAVLIEVLEVSYLVNS